MLTIQNLTKTYKHHTAVSDLSFTVGRGEAFALLGSNGAGKTTTIRMILGLAQPTGGTIATDAASIGYQPESPGFPPFLTGREVLEYYAKLQGMNRRAAQEEAGRLLALTGLEDTGTKAKHYSKGMLQRLALAQALIGEPELLLLDEPTAGLDAVGRVEMIRLLTKLKNDGKPSSSIPIFLLMWNAFVTGASFSTKVVCTEAGTKKTMRANHSKKSFWIRWRQ